MYRTITLSDRPPVRINEDLWDLVASATNSEHDGQVECQANRKTSWAVRVRQHEDGRTIVSAVYSYTSNWQGARCYSVRHGLMLAARPDSEALVGAIKTVCDRMASSEAHDNDAERWGQLADECIADLPVEDLDVEATP